jgi:hypothetical protein
LDIDKQKKYLKEIWDYNEKLRGQDIQRELMKIVDKHLRSINKEIDLMVEEKKKNEGELIIPDPPSFED